MARSRRTSSQQSLTQACKALLRELEDDLREALREQPQRTAALRAEHAEALRRQRTARGWEEWLSERLTQIGASWILACVFVRFAEDRGLVEPLLSGPVDPDPRRNRRDLARHHEREYLDRNPTHAAGEWMEHVFRTHAALPAMRDLLDEGHAMLWQLRPTPEGARTLLEFWRTLDDGGQVRWRFERAEGSAEGPQDDTRFLGDLYQDLSESARKQYALLQTPDFVEAFILDRTLEPAIATFGLERTHLIDPTCGSGHFLLGAFRRLLEHRRRREPGRDIREQVTAALDAVAGVDINPFAVAIARFRLLIAALEACGITSLREAPNFPIHLAVGDSLLHGPRFNDSRVVQLGLGVAGVEEDAYTHLYEHEQSPELRRILGRQYEAVVGNPPYITPKDKAANDAYRERFKSCSRKYALSVPFLERFVELAVTGGDEGPAGFVGQITANSFMKREFGALLVERFLPRWDLTAVVDTSGAYIPGHGTPTVILLLRNQWPKAPTVRAVLGIRGEPATPADPAKGQVWSAIVAQFDHPGSESAFVSVEDRERKAFHSHPWSIGGGGAAELVDRVNDVSTTPLEAASDSIGISCFTLEDDVFIRPPGAFRRAGCGVTVRPMIEGDAVRDWSVAKGDVAAFPYDSALVADTSHGSAPARRLFWPHRSNIANSIMFAGRTKVEDGLAWFEYGRLTADKLRTPLSIAFAFVATHNHFVLDRGGKVFKQSAPIIKLPAEASEREHLALLELLNSSLACFWIRQVVQPKTGFGAGLWEQRLEIDSTKLARFPLPGEADSWRQHGHYATQLDSLAAQRGGLLPSAERLLTILDGPTSLESALEADRSAAEHLLARMIALQEELDWSVYHAYGLLDDSSGTVLAGEPPPLALGQRAFEIVMARRMAAGDLSTTWFERHRSTPITDLPAHWPAAYRATVERRIAVIESNRDIALIERPECKRRWNTQPWTELLASALTEALLDRIEALPDWRCEHPRPFTATELADRLARDDRFMALLRLRTQDQTPNVAAEVAAIVEANAVGFLPALRFTESGQRKHAEWLECWREQRIEDPYLDRMEDTLEDLFGASPAAMARARKLLVRWRAPKARTKLKPDATFHREQPVPDADEVRRRETILARHEAIDAERRAALGGKVTPAVPPKYKANDYATAAGWTHRGGLDVPKERFISYSRTHSQTRTSGRVDWSLGPAADRTPLVGWAGWDHAQQAAALVHLLEARAADGWTGEQMAPILLGVLDLVPWLSQWHTTSEHDLGRVYAAWVEEQALQHGLTLEQVRSWTPPARTTDSGRTRRREVPAKHEQSTEPLLAADSAADFNDTP